MKLFGPWRRSFGVAAGVRLMRAAADDTVLLLPGLRAAIPAFIHLDATI
jgi:hypothetical protein